MYVSVLVCVLSFLFIFGCLLHPPYAEPTSQGYLVVVIHVKIHITYPYEFPL